MILTSFFRAVGQLSDPRFRKVLWVGIALTIALLVAAYAVLLYLLESLAGGGFLADIFGEVTWVGDLLGWASLALMIVLSVFLMVPVASAITSMFLDQVAAAVEDKHYSHLPPVAPVPFYESFKDTLNFLGLLIAANIFALVLYIILPFAALFIFWGLNGFLLGREYYFIAAMRRVGRDGAKQRRRENFGKIWLAGCLMAVPLSIPLINLIIPILGAATFTHLFHAIEQRAPSGQRNPGRAQ